MGYPVKTWCLPTLKPWGWVSLQVAWLLDFLDEMRIARALRPPTFSALPKMVPATSTSLSLFPSEAENRSARLILRGWGFWLVGPSRKFTVKESNTTRELRGSMMPMKVPTTILKKKTVELVAIESPTKKLRPRLNGRWRSPP